MSGSGLKSQNRNWASQLNSCMERGLEGLSCLKYEASRAYLHLETLYMPKNVLDAVHNTVAAHQENISNSKNDVAITWPSRLERL
jgi:hypothetical protein